MSYSREAVAALRRRRIEAGVCISCALAKEPERQHRRECEICAQKSRDRITTRNLERRAAGQCRDCCRDVAAGDYLCKPCRGYRNASRREGRKKT